MNGIMDGWKDEVYKHPALLLANPKKKQHNYSII